jgi:hypothetical protein
MRNEALETLDMLVAEWALPISDAWFLEPPGTEVHGTATVEWFGDRSSPCARSSAER